MSKPSKPIPRLGRGLSSLISSSVELPPASDKEFQHVTGLPPVVLPTPQSYVSQAAPPLEAPTGEPMPPAAQDVPAPEPAIRRELGDTTAGDQGRREIPVSAITPNPYQPRREFDLEQLNELAASISQQGVLQPLIVAPAAPPDQDKAFVLIAGERRLRAARLAGLGTVPCVIRQATRQQMLEWALVENIQRSDLNAVERAHAYRDFMDRFQLTQAEAAVRLGQNRATVAHYLRVLDLCDDVQQMLVTGQLTFGHAKVLAGLAGQLDRQKALARKAVAQPLSVRQLENLVASLMDASGQARRPHQVTDKPPYLLDLEDQLTRTVGTKVAILPGKAKHSGRIAIEYYSLDDFDRITALLGLRVQS